MDKMKNIIKHSLFLVPIVGIILYILYKTTPGSMTFQQWAFIATSIGVVLTGLRALQDWDLSRKQHAEEFRWKKSELAMKVLDAIFADTSAKYALTMIDWSNKEYTLATGKIVLVTWEDVAKALRTHTSATEFSDTEYFIRDSFDSLFDHLQRIAHLIEIKLITIDDVSHRLKYWAKRMLDGEIPNNDDQIKKYMRFYGSILALKLLEDLLIDNLKQ